MKGKKMTEKKKVPLNLRIPEDMKEAIDLAVDEYNTNVSDFPITRNDMATLFIKEGLERWGKVHVTRRRS